MNIIIKSRRRNLARLPELWQEATIIDVTSRGNEPWVRFSPFYPHGGIPIPNTPGEIAEAAEGLWQGLKVFEREDIDPSKWAITDLAGIQQVRRFLEALHPRGVGYYRPGPYQAWGQESRGSSWPSLRCGQRPALG